ncbi:MAG TPA: HAMP domain-containing sensor histidine kinase [bacterium]|nr:HAMP domain-containing sensor histidine kinase [bacterium]
MAKTRKDRSPYVRENVLALRRRRRFIGVYFAVALGLVAAMLILHTLFVITRLRHEFRVTSQSYATFQTLLASDLQDPAMEEVIIMLAQDIGRTMTFPTVATDAEGTPQVWWPGYNDRLGPDPDENLEVVKGFAADLDRESAPIPIMRYEIDAETGRPADRLLGEFHYGEPRTVRLMYLVPALELALIAAFAFTGTLAYRRLKRTEQQAVWAGMARETAHQLGTPVTSLIGWLEHLRERAAGDESLREPLEEMAEDIKRLEKVAARFQEIGAPVRLAEGDVVPLVRRALAYGRRRAPARARIAFEAETPPELVVPHSPVLVEWVVENFVKNAVDATKDLAPGQGRIVVEAREEKGCAAISVTDNGVGISAAELRLIFTPGYSTKEKGWGLGLSLVKRIVEEVHHGRLEVRSEAGEGSTFKALIPKGRKTRGGQ